MMLKYRTNQTPTCSLTAPSKAENRSLVFRILAVCVVAIALFSVFLIKKAGAESGSSPNAIASTLAPNVTFMDPNIDLAVQDLYVQPDGKIVIGGNFANVGGQPRKKVARLNSDGSLDTTFVDPNVTSTTGNDTVFAVARSPGGGIVIGGLFDTVAGVPRQGIAMINDDGTLLSGFVPNLNGSVMDISFRNGGSLIAGGFFTTADGQPCKRVVRLTGLGTLDQSFQDPNIDGAVRVVVEMPDGKILIGGEFQNVGGQPHQHIARLNINGTVDSTFNANIDNFVNDIAPSIFNGDMIVGGEFTTVNGLSRFRLVKLNSVGATDPNFLPAVLSPASSIQAVTWFGSKVFIGGTFTSVGGVNRRDFAALNDTFGTLDPIFHDPGISGSFGGVNAITIQPDQKILLGGDFQDFGIQVFKKVARVLTSGFLELPPSLQLTVTKTADTNDGVCDADCSLREAIAVANATNNESLIFFDPTLFGSPQTIVLTNGELVITNSREMQISGTGSDLVTISGNNQSRVLRLGPGAKAYVNAVTLTNGNGVSPVNSGTGGGVFLGTDSVFHFALGVLSNNTASQAGGIGHSGHVTMNIDFATITGNSSTTNNPSAGAIYLDNGTLYIAQVTVSNNSANNSSGGAIHIESSFASMDMQSCIVTGNTAKYGGGIYNSGTSIISNSTIANNQALQFSGGGIFNENGIMTVTNVTVENNTAALDSGGGIFNFGRLIINGGFVRNNTSQSGGGIWTAGGLTLTGTPVTENTATTGAGGGIYNNSGGPSGLPATTISSAIIDGNKTLNNFSGFGGGVYNRDILTVTGTTISNNSSKNGGGGIFHIFLNGIPAILTVTNSTISGNTTQGGGGGMWSPTGTATFSNSTISGNSAVSFGGGVLLGSAATLNLMNVTVAYNRAGVSGGGVLNDSSTVNAKNSIIARNGAGNPSVLSDLEGTLESQGYNLIGSTNGTVIHGTTTGNLLDIDPMLGPLGTYGTANGLPKTHALRFNSPATDAGSPAVPVLSTDQRGKPRPFDFPSIPNASGGDGSDIGSFERQTNDPTRFYPAEFDFDGDGRGDVSVFRPSEGAWYISGSLSGFSAQFFGLATDKLAPADFDGDGKTDVAVFRDGFWYIMRSSLGFTSVVFGQAGDIPVPGDFDGDGTADIAVFRPATGNFYTLQSSNGAFGGLQWGADGDIPVIGDYSGDRRVDFTVFRPSTGTFYISRSFGDPYAVQFGTTGDKPIAADFDGDSRTDIAVYRPSTNTWYYLQSSDNGFRSVVFGTSGDLPAAADYDGDGKADVAVFRPSNGTFYILQSTTGTLGSQRFGSASDVPVAGAFLP